MDIESIIKEKDAEIKALKTEIEDLKSAVEYWRDKCTGLQDVVDMIRLTLKMNER